MAVFKREEHNLPCKMSNDEFISKSNELIALEVDIQRMEEQIENAKAKLALVKSTFKDPISICRDNIETTILELKRRLVYRDVDCIAILDHDRSCSYVRRLDDMEIVPNSLRELSMENFVNQEDLFGPDIPDGISHDELLISDEEFDKEKSRAEKNASQENENEEKTAASSTEPLRDNDQPGEECDPGESGAPECTVESAPPKETEPKDAPETT